LLRSWRKNRINEKAGKVVAVDELWRGRCGQEIYSFRSSLNRVTSSDFSDWVQERQEIPLQIVRMLVLNDGFPTRPRS
jgi:hypothetical protein